MNLNAGSHRGLEIVDMNQTDLWAKPCVLRPSAHRCCRIRSVIANFHELVTLYIVKMSASIIRWMHARQARPSCLTLCGDQRDQTL